MKRKSVSVMPRFGFLYRIGYCQKCMRQSFIIAFISISIYMLSLFLQKVDIYENTIIERFLLVLSLMTTLLWFLHIFVKSFRVLRDEGQISLFKAKRDEVGFGNPVTLGSFSKRRRHFIRRGLLLIASTAFATAIPSLANAWGECPGRLNCGWGSCAQRTNNDVYCCPKGFPILSLCDCKCYQSVQGMPCNQTGSCFDENF